MDVTDEGDELGLAHVHLHQSLINLTQVHHLVDKSQDTFGIATDGLVDAATVRVVILFDE